MNQMHNSVPLVMMRAPEINVTQLRIYGQDDTLAFSSITHGKSNDSIFLVDALIKVY